MPKTLNFIIFTRCFLGGGNRKGKSILIPKRDAARGSLSVPFGPVPRNDDRDKAFVLILSHSLVREYQNDLLLETTCCSFFFSFFFGK
jgi:hypothetical protein